MKKIIYIDDDSEARETYTEVLQEVFGGDFELKDIAPEFLLEDMLIKINDMHSVAGFVLDEKMNQLGQANFVGQSLAKKIRELDYKIPIYIFTAFKNEFNNEFGPAEVEYVIDKNELSDEETLESLTAKVRRHQNVYNDIMSERAEKLDEYLRKFLNGAITPAEKEELDQLNFLRKKNIVLQDSLIDENVNELFTETAKKIEDIYNKIKRI